MKAEQKIRCCWCCKRMLTMALSVGFSQKPTDPSDRGCFGSAYDALRRTLSLWPFFIMLATVGNSRFLASDRPHSRRRDRSMR